MNEYTKIIQATLDASSVDASRLAVPIGVLTVKDNLDVIIKNTEKSQAPFKATTVSIVAKLVHPDWDTRKHQTQIGGKFSLRSIDRTYVSSYLHSHGLYDKATEFALTRSFEKAEPYIQTYSGNISPDESKSAFLNLVEVINTTASEDLLRDMLAYLMSFLKQQKNQKTTLMSSTVESSKELTIADVAGVYTKILELGSGISAVPVIMVYTLLRVVQPYVFEDIAIKELNHHTAADSRTGSYGDVEGFDKDSKPCIAIEVKHQITITDTIVETFSQKTKDIPLKFILTTGKVSMQFVKKNICLNSVLGFVQGFLHQTLIRKPSICSDFLLQLRKNINESPNLSVDRRTSIDALLRSLLA